ncbi:MAG TPA: gamma-glutamyltransferase [Chloroflexota bacterium]|nr:gamma-glutamyltransferase [Chloroflexota bacterium]
MTVRTDRPLVMGTQGMVATGHHLATQAGLRILQRGGNAVDAAIAAAAVVAVCKPSMNSLGGDNMSLLWNARTQELTALNANGWAPAAATLDQFAVGIPVHGPRAASVPGAVAGWDALLERSGTKGLPELLEDAIGYARSGFPVSHLLHDEMETCHELLQARPATSRVFLPGGRVPAAGDVLVQADLAASLETLAAQGAKAFYRGELAQRIVECMAAEGGLIAAADLDQFRPQWKPPIHVSYRGVDVFGQPAPSQGFIMAEELNILEGCDPRALRPGELQHIMIEAKKLAFADRSAFLGDPDFAAVPMDRLLSKGHAARQRERIGEHAEAAYQAESGGETTYLAVVDRWGNAVSFIQSIFRDFGSGVVVDGTGILLNDRMLGFNTQAGHVNAVGPRKRPVMTLNTCMLFRDGRPWVVFGTPGADAQVQSNFQQVVHWVDEGLDVQQAIERPRWLHISGTDVLLEAGWDAAVADVLAAKGHKPRIGPRWDKRMGGVQAISIDRVNGVLSGGADPRREGYAQGW